MGVLDRFEKGIERVVNGAFAKAFRSQVEPVELAGALRKEADDRAAVVSRGRTLTANSYVFELSAADYDRLEPIATDLLADLRQVAGDHAVSQGYTFVGPVTVTFEEADDLDTGMYRVRASTRRSDGTPAAQPASRGGYDPVSRAHPIVPEVYAHQAQSTPGHNADLPSDHIPPAPQVTVDTDSQDPGPTSSAPAASRPRRTAQRTFLAHVHDTDHLLPEGTTVFGRSSQSADVVVDDPGASRAHFRVTVEGGHATAQDMDSTNGTLLDGHRIDTVALTDGVELLVGDTPVTFRIDETGGR
ncbi:DUF3662 and FHA domain-containing protein [Brevibacterium litoralis]|uniref:DUF3662 and FHA domain-containing protein n=1 Tax=Brevibacterium litoralis TaxID=3138935 RepID=UPI0032EB6CE1